MSINIFHTWNCQGFIPRELLAVCWPPCRASARDAEARAGTVPGLETEDVSVAGWVPNGKVDGPKQTISIGPSCVLFVTRVLRKRGQCGMQKNRFCLRRKAMFISWTRMDMGFGGSKVVARNQLGLFDCLRTGGLCYGRCSCPKPRK